jgi:hypothetical protein
MKEYFVKILILVYNFICNDKLYEGFENTIHEVDDLELYCLIIMFRKNRQENCLEVFKKRKIDVSQIKLS